jgi:hypothetical protein
VAELNRVLPPGLDILDAVEARTSGFVERLEASIWQIELPEVSPETAKSALQTFLASSEVMVERLTKNGIRRFDARAAVLNGQIREDFASYAILDLVVRHETPAVRPDDVLAALKNVAELSVPVAPRVTRLAQGPLLDDGWQVADPLAADR